MRHSIERGLDTLVDRYAAACIVPALFVLSVVGVGDVVVVCLLGLLLCLAGLTKQSARVDLWVLIPLLIYDLACLVSTYAAYGEIVGGYGVTHAVFPAIYLLLSCLEQGERHMLRWSCALWVGAAGAVGIGRFVFQAVTLGRVGRMSGLLGNPNAMGIFLVLGWFIVMDCAEEDKTGRLSSLEPLLLMGTAMTLSMGSFVAMAAGILVLVAENNGTQSWGATIQYACRILAKASLGMGTGLLIFLAGARTDAPWSCLFLLAYGAAVAALWRRYERFLEAKPRMAALIAGLGTLVAAAAVVIRPSAIATFTERLEMMASGLRYLTVNPLWGVGPFQWRLLDLNDGGKYFNTWHIHNTILHVGVEMGWIAMGALIVVVLRLLSRRSSPPVRALAAAFLVHNMIDTSFFYLGVTALALTAAGGFRTQGPGLLKNGAVKLLFALLAGLFVYGLCYTVMTR